MGEGIVEMHEGDQQHVMKKLFTYSRSEKLFPEEHQAAVCAHATACLRSCANQAAQQKYLFSCPGALFLG